MRFRVERKLRISVAAAIAMATPACWPIMAETVPEKAIPPIGKLVDIGGRRLHLNCSGEGSPTVVLESGERDLSLVRALVQPDVAPFARVCSYDRAGYAWSDAGPEPRTITQIVFELHRLLGAAGEKGPYVMAGASVGGDMVRAYAHQYPGDVAGMVLVDSVHEDDVILDGNKMCRLRDTAQKRAIPPVKTGPEPVAEGETLVWKQTKVTSFSPGNARVKLPPELQRIWIVARKQDKYNVAAHSEFAYLPEEMEELHEETVAEPQPLGKKPLIVMTREIALIARPAVCSRRNWSAAARIARPNLPGSRLTAS